MIPKTKHAGTNYKFFKPFIDAADNNDGCKHFVSDGYMDLVIENLEHSDHEGRPVYSVAHYGKQNGDLMCDPDVEFSVDDRNGCIIPRTFQNDYIGLYQHVFKTSGEKTYYSPSLLRELDQFLWEWSKNIAFQGFKPV